MALELTKHVNGRMWPPGVSGNPNGRPVGSRTIFSQGFLKDLAEVWSQEGRETMVKTARTNLPFSSQRAPSGHCAKRRFGTPEGHGIEQRPAKKAAGKVIKEAIHFSTEALEWLPLLWKSRRGRFGSYGHFACGFGHGDVLREDDAVGQPYPKSAVARGDVKKTTHRLLRTLG